MASGFSVNVAEVRAHSRTVAACSAQVRSAIGSAQSVSDGAYGVIGQFFASAILGACGDVVQGIAKVATAVDDVREGLQAVADQYSSIDADIAATLDEAGA